MAGVNKVIILGRLGTDPEVKTISSGNTVAQFTVATSDQWRDGQGQMQERTEWHRIVVWGKQAEMCGKYLSKGRQAYIEGRLQTRSWEDKQGQKRYTTEIVAQRVQFLGSSQSQQSESSHQGLGHSFDDHSDLQPSSSMGFEPSFDSNEDLPF